MSDGSSLPLHTIQSLARSGETGKLSWKSEELEAAVYFEGGRLAWATTSTGHFSFAKALVERALVDPAVLRVFVDRSRSDGQPFGESLVRAGIATADTVRELLRLQVKDALDSLAAVRAGSASFIPRPPSGYDRSFTFPFDEVAPRRRERKVTRDFAPPPRTETPNNEAKDTMANIKDTLSKLVEIDGAIGACAVDSNSGMMLGSAGGGVFNLEVAAAGNTDVVRAKRKTMKALGLNDSIDDILITLGRQYHLIRPIASNDALFIYLVLDKSKSNLAMARHQLQSLERDLSM